MVGIDEGSPQPQVGARYLHSPDFVRSGKPPPGAIEHLKEGRGDQGKGDRPAAAAIPSGNSGGDESRGGRRERQRRPERFAGRQRQRARPSRGAAQKLARGVEQANVARRDRRGERPGPGQRLKEAEQGDTQERAGRPLQSAEGAGRFAARERQGKDCEDGHFEQRLAPPGDAAERQRRPKEENRDRTGHQPFRLAYHRATVPRTPGRLHPR